MFAPIKVSVVILSGLALAAGSALAGVPGLMGNVKDANGRPLAGAEIRIEGKDGAAAAQTLSTDASGHYLFPQTASGTFNVTLLVNGSVRACITNVAMNTERTETLNFELKRSSVQPNSRGKHYVWVPGGTGTNIKGSWVEVDDRPKTASLGMAERQNRAGQEMVQRIQDNSANFGSGH